MRRPIAIAGLSIVAVLVLAGAAAGPLMSKIEHPPYTVERADGPIELRAYSAMVVATTKVDGSRGAAIQTGFRTLADYIFGANDGARKIAMTAPVMQGSDAAEAAGSASADAVDKKGTWSIRFVMPRAMPMDRLPTPHDRRVTLETTSPATFAVIRFSGFWRDALLRQKTEELKTFLAQNKLVARSAPIYAFYNPPWTLPIFRRNEVMIEVVRE